MIEVAILSHDKEFEPAIGTICQNWTVKPWATRRLTLRDPIGPDILLRDCLREAIEIAIIPQHKNLDVTESIGSLTQTHCWSSPCH